MAAYILLITAPDRSIKTVEITQPTALVGREAGDVIVSDPRCSSRHAEITFDGQSVRYRDLGSTNGTWSQGKRVTEILWQRGASVDIGKHKLTLQDIRSTEGAGKTLVAGQTAYVPPSVLRAATGETWVRRHVLQAPRAYWAVAALVAVSLGSTLIWQTTTRGGQSETGISPATEPGAGSAKIKIVTVSHPDDPARVKGHLAETRVRVSPNTASSVSVGITEEFLDGAGDQWRTATWLAAFNATRTKGDSLGAYDFNVYVRGHIDGPSAGMFMTVAMLALMRGQALRPDVTMTGAINPDGTAGPVACIVEKLAAAKDAKMRAFGFPIGTRQSQSCATKQYEDIVTLAHKKGIEAHELVDVYDAYELATGTRLSRPTPVSDADIAVSGQTQQMLQVKVQDWRARIDRELEDHKARQEERQKRGAQTVSLSLAQYFFDRAQGDERNDYLASAVDGYAEAAINIALVNRFASAAERLTQAKKTEHEKNLKTVQTELNGFCRQLEINYQGRTRGGQLSATYAFTNYIYAQAMLGIAQDALGRLATGQSKDRNSDTGISYAYCEIAHEYLERARYVQDLVSDEGETPPLTAEAVERTVASFASAAAAALASFDALILAPKAQKKNVSLEQERQAWKEDILNYAMTLNAIKLAQSRGASACESGPLVRLAAAGQAYLWAATLLNTWNSLKAEPKVGLSSITISNRKALSAQLDIARLNAREGAGRARSVVHYVPTAARIAYQRAASRRDGSDDDKVQALQAYWESAFWSELAASP